MSLEYKLKFSSASYTYVTDAIRLDASASKFKNFVKKYYSKSVGSDITVTR